MSRGKILGDRYKIGEKIGSGGFSTVYFCVDLQAAVDVYLEDRRKEYEEYRLSFEIMKAEERLSTQQGGKKGSGRRKGSIGGLGSPVTFEALCGSVPGPEEVIHPDVLQALLTTGRVPMMATNEALAGGGKRKPSRGTATYPPQATDRASLLSPTLYRANSPAVSSLASTPASQTSRRKNGSQQNLFKAATADVTGSEVLIHWSRTVVPPVYAVKVLNKAQLKHLCMEDAFDREVEAMKAITRSQPSNVINVLDVLQSTRNYYLVMDLADQGSLLAVIVRNNATLTGGGGGGLPGPAARKYFRQLINGLSFVHGADVVHRDIKPENLLLDRWRDVRISDFGFAAYSPPGRMLTRPCGTPQYAAPEVLVDSPRYDGRKVDMWSSGITLFVIAFGCLPFYANTNEKLYGKITRGVYEIPTTLRKPPPPSLIHLLSVLLDTNPKSRWSVEMVRVHPWVLGRDDIPERLQASYLLTMKRRYMQEKRQSIGAKNTGGRIQSPNSENENDALGVMMMGGKTSLPQATKSFLALTSAAGLDPTKVQRHLHQQPMMGRSLGSDASSTDHHEHEMEALMMDLDDDDGGEFLEGTDGYLFVQQHRRNVATVTQASSSCPNLRQIQGGFVVDGGRSKETGNNQLHRGGTTPSHKESGEGGLPSGNSSAFFTVEPMNDACVPCEAAAAEALVAEDAFDEKEGPTKSQSVAVEPMGCSLNLDRAGSLGGSGLTPPRQSNQVPQPTEPTNFRGSHLIDMLEHSIGDGSIVVDVETGRLVLLDGMGWREKLRLSLASERVLTEHPEVELTRYAKVLTPLLAHFDRIREEEQHDSELEGGDANGWGQSYTPAPPPAATPPSQASILGSAVHAIQDEVIHRRLPPLSNSGGGMRSVTPPSIGARRESLGGALLASTVSKSSTPSSRPQSTPNRTIKSGGERTPEEMKKREKRSPFLRLGLVHIQIVLNFIAVFAIIFVAGTAKVLFDVDVAKWPMPAFLRRFIDHILSPPKQASSSSPSTSTGFNTSRSSPGTSTTHPHPKRTSPAIDSMSSLSSTKNRGTPNWPPHSSSPGAAFNSFGSKPANTHYHHHRHPSNTNFAAVSAHLLPSSGGTAVGPHHHSRTPSNTKSITDTPLATTQPQYSNDHGPSSALLRPPSTFTLSSTPLTTASTIPMSRSPGFLPHTNSPSQGVQFPASEPPPHLGGSLGGPSGGGNLLLRPKPSRKHSNLSSASSEDDRIMPRTLTAQHSEQSEQVVADPVPTGSARLLQAAPLFRIGSESSLTGKHSGLTSPHLQSKTVLNSSFHSGDLHTKKSVPPPISLPIEAAKRSGGGDAATPMSSTTVGLKGGLRRSTGGEGTGNSASPILKRVKLSASAYRRSGVLDEDLDPVGGVLADEEAHDQQGFKPSQQAKMGLQKMKRIDSHVALQGGGGLADMDDDDTTLAT